MTQLLTPLRIGSSVAPNRLVMAPVTRSRADDDGAPSDLTVTYYAQRASAALIISEGVFPSAMGKGYVHTPGIETEVNAPDRNTFFAPPTAKGYIDYPGLAVAEDA